MQLNTAHKLTNDYWNLTFNLKSHTHTHAHTRAHTHTHTFNGPLSGTIRVSRYQKDKTNLDFTEARDSEWQWHQLGHMLVCTSLQTDNHASTPLFTSFTGRMPFLPPNQQRQSTEGILSKINSWHFRTYFGCIEIGEHEVYRDDVGCLVQCKHCDQHCFVNHVTSVQHARQAQQCNVLSYIYALAR